LSPISSGETSDVPQDAESFEAPTSSIVHSWFDLAAQGATDLLGIAVTAKEMDTANMFLAHLNVEETVDSDDDSNTDSDELQTQALVNRRDIKVTGFDWLQIDPMTLLLVFQR
jgi:hypothetical protein